MISLHSTIERILKYMSFMFCWFCLLIYSQISQKVIGLKSIFISWSLPVWQSSCKYQNSPISGKLFKTTSVLLLCNIHIIYNVISKHINMVYQILSFILLSKVQACLIPVFYDVWGWLFGVLQKTHPNIMPSVGIYQN